MVALVWFRRDLHVHDHPALWSGRAARISRDCAGPIVDHKQARQAALDRYRDAAAAGS